MTTTEARCDNTAVVETETLLLKQRITSYAGLRERLLTN